jgi:hypothetical protein
MPTSSSPSWQNTSRTADTRRLRFDQFNDPDGCVVERGERAKKERKPRRSRRIAIYETNFSSCYLSSENLSAIQYILLTLATYPLWRVTKGALMLDGRRQNHSQAHRDAAFRAVYFNRSGRTCAVSLRCRRRVASSTRSRGLRT